MTVGVRRAAARAGGGGPGAEPSVWLDATRHRSRSGRRLALDLLGIGWLVLAAVALLVPALRHGAFLGPYAVARYGLLGHSSAAVPNSDLVTEMVPWASLVWHQVHAGHLPLWDPYSGLGLPLAFNWQSAPFGVPALVSYLFPVRFAFDVSVVVTLLVAGLGAYVFGRVLGLGVVGCVLAGTAFEFSGPFVGWLGYPLGAVMAWTGWVLAAVLLVVRGRHRARAVAFLAVAVACAVYAGNPESLATLAPALAVVVVVLLAVRVARRGVRAEAGGVVGLALGVAGGFALAAPLALPGYQLASVTTRASLQRHRPVGPAFLVYSLFSNNLHGSPLPLEGRHVYFYAGVIAVVLAVVGVVARWRRPPVAALAAGAVAVLALVYVGPVDRVVDLLPVLRTVYWSRALMVCAFLVAVLAGVGLDWLLRVASRRRAGRWLVDAAGAAGVAVALVWAFGRGHLAPAAAHAQASSFVWPAVAVVVLLVAGVVLSAAGRADRVGRDERGNRGGALPVARQRFDLPRAVAAALLVGCETAFLVATGAPSLSASATYRPMTPALRTLLADVGSATVGFDGAGVCVFGPDLGVRPEVNVLYDLHELAVYDPIIPRAYFSTWKSTTGQVAGFPALATFCPSVGSAAVARRFGVRYVLAARGVPPPAGTVDLGPVGAEVLYRVPGAAPAVLAPAGPTGAAVGPGRPVQASQPNPSTWVVPTDAARPSVLELHVTDVPGWRATLDGRPLALRPYGGVMLQADVPPGRHTVVVTYWPPAFTVGLYLAVVAVVALVAAVVVERRRVPRNAAS